jgi:predicted RecB family nuclease
VQLIDGRPVFAATDLVGFLACRHRFGLERAALAGLVTRPDRSDPEIELIRKRGFEHEARYRADLEAAGRTVVEILPDGSTTDAGVRLRTAATATRRALERGIEVVYQATFFDGRWRGHADFLLRVDRPSALGDWSYEVADTKLARRVKASAVLQICSYVEQLTAIQGLQPESLHVVLGGSARQQESLPVGDYMAYYRQVKGEFEAAVAAVAVAYPVTETYPDPVEHCDVCRWSAHCQAQRRADDDLSLVAGISARQRAALKARGVRTRRRLAGVELPLVPPLEGVGAAALARVHDQARLQVEGEATGTVLWELLEPDRDGAGHLIPDRGLLALPEPSPNDLFFDIEGDPFALDDGVEYLFGVLEPSRPQASAPDRPTFHELWSLDAGGRVTRAAEKAAFERLVDLLVERRSADPTLHVYHYAAYERSALGRLAQRHGTREAEVDQLFREGVLVDLYRVVRQAIRASTEGYSIKQLEPLYGLHREIGLKSAGSSIVAFEAWLEGGSTDSGAAGEAILREIADYNRDDVVSNWRLRNWLEARRWDLESMIDERPGRPGPGVTGAEPNPATERDALVADLSLELTAGLPADSDQRTTTQQATWLLAQLLGWHRREDKAFWWRYYELLDMSDAARLVAREPLAGLVPLVGDREPGSDATVERFAFPHQEHALKVGGSVVDPTTRRTTGTVTDLDEATQVVTIRRRASELEHVPTSLVPFDFVPTDVLQDSLLRVGRAVLAAGIETAQPGRAGLELLLRRPPSLGQVSGEALRRADEDQLAAARRLGLALAGRPGVLPIQGPPGSGKTFTGARMVVDLVRAGRKVGVTANSHKVIGHLLDEIAAAGEGDPAVRLGQRPGSTGEPTCPAATSFKDNGKARRALDDGSVTILGGTAWVWANEVMAGAVDVLVVEEAGQLSLANAIAVSPAAASLVLLGDPQQLDQPLRGSHPPGAERSALGHLLGAEPTIAPPVGLFLERTWRLHPDVCRFTSELFYAGQLLPVAALARQALAGPPPTDGTGLRWLPVEHAGNTTGSIEEAEAVTAIVAGLLAVSPTWTAADGAVVRLGLRDLVVVAPYNDHVELIARHLAAAGFPGANVGTVDKFQGQQAVLSIYAMGSSSAADAPRGMEFLYSLNRLNVATSRARCLAIVVASPALVRVACQTPHQMRLANALCRLVEIAAEERRRDSLSPA